MQKEENRDNPKKTLFGEWQTRSLGRVLADRMKSGPNGLPDLPEEELEACYSPDSKPVCHRCFAPLDETEWFCRECGASVGQYNNLLPFIRLFSYGEVLRNGLNPNVVHSRRMKSFYLLGGLLMLGPFAVIYWVRYFRAQRRAQPGQPGPGPRAVTTGALRQFWLIVFTDLFVIGFAGVSFIALFEGNPGYRRVLPMVCVVFSLMGVVNIRVQGALSREEHALPLLRIFKWLSYAMLALVGIGGGLIALSEMSRG